MANAEHLERLKQGVEAWNQWREKNFEVTPDLSFADLSDIDLSDADLSFADLSHVSLSKAKLIGADLSDAKLRKTYLIKADLSGAKLIKADLTSTKLIKADLTFADLTFAKLVSADLNGADLSDADLSGADLSDADLSSAKMLGVNLTFANLHHAYISDTDLSFADLSDADLSGADLSYVQVLGTSLERAVLTGACLQDWNTNNSTKFEGTVCEYIYLEAEQKERRPREDSFKPREFAALFQQAVDTIDLIFKDGIDWQAFFHSLRELRSQYADDNLSIQAIERKQGDAFVVRLEVAEDADKSAIESSAKELYETNLTLLEQRYRAELQAKDGEIVAYREQSANLMKITEMLAARPPMSEGNKYDLRGAQFGGGYVAGNVEGNQYGGTINNYGSNAEDITRLLAALRDQAQTFPTDQKDEANDVLDDLERDLADEQPDPGRIGRRLKKLVALGAAIGTIASGAAAVSGDVSTFTGNVIELTEQLGIPVEQVQLPSSNQP